VYSSSPAEEPAIVIYYPTVRIPETAGWTPSMMTLAIRTTLDRPLSLLPQIRAAVVQVDPAVPLANPQEMQTLLSRSMSRVSFAMTLIGLAAAMALLLAAIGLYGVIAYVVARRTGEIGIRMALGAQTRQVQRLVVGSSLKLVGLGLVAGGGGALLLTQVMRGLLYGVQPTDPSAYVAGAALLMAVALLASYLPARRAAQVDPVVALRGE
jgi:ABC-type antimicrobial peptide transport system permease subunit